ncbi:MAG: hypothetical protein ACOZQL_20330 [Myxococcota bacterium]
MHLCFVLLPDATQLTARALEKACKEFPDLGKPKWGGTKKGVAHFTVDGVEVVAALLPAPVPEGEADHATDRSLSGLDGTWALPEHRAHLAVVHTGDKKKKPSLATLTTFTRAVAAIVRATHAVGVYWGEGGATHHPEFVVNIAQSELPLPIWVGVSIAKAKRGVELLSLGMHKQLGLPDLLLRAPEADGATLEFFYDLLAYVVRRGEAIPAGETVGRDERERLAVKYAKSPIDAEAEVWVVQLPAARKKKAR